MFKSSAMTELFALQTPDCLNLTAQSSRTRSTRCPPFPAYSLLSIAARSSQLSTCRFTPVSSTWRLVNFFDVSSTFWRFVNFFDISSTFFLLTPNLTKKVDETSIQKVAETSVPRPSVVWRRPYTGVSGRLVFACLQPVRRREFSWVYTGVVLANRVYRGQ